MNLQQLRFCADRRPRAQHFQGGGALHNISAGVTRQIRQLEEELKAELLVRRGNRISALTEAGSAVPNRAPRPPRYREYPQCGNGHADANKGTLSVATTHVHARYILMPVVQRFDSASRTCVSAYVRGSGPDRALVSAGGADLGLATHRQRKLYAVRLPAIGFVVACWCQNAIAFEQEADDACATWRVSDDHLDASFASGVSVMSTSKQGHYAEFVLKRPMRGHQAYVAAGLGIATVPEIAFDPRRKDAALRRQGSPSFV